MRRVANSLGAFGRHQGGSLVVWFALALIPLLFAVGTGLDYARGVNLKAQLQSAADAAALAGAGVYVSSGTAGTASTVASNYMANVAAAMGTDYAVTYTVATSSQSSGSNATLYAVTVTASGSIKNSIMAMARTTTPASVTATAKNPVYTITLTLSSYSSSAADANTLYYYIVPTDNSAPASSALTQFFTNNGKNSTASITLQLTASQKLGFALINVTGGRTGSYGTNAYGGTYKSSHTFYSHMFPPSKVAYPSVTTNRSLQVTTTAAAVQSGVAFSYLFANSALNCAAASGQTLIYSWNDMGGGYPDDLDYNDMVYTVKCSQNDTSAAQGVVLTN